MFDGWGELPPALQNAVGAATLTYQEQPSEVDGDAVGPGLPASAVAAVRAACRSLRDGVDGAVTGITATIHELGPGQTHLRLGRFPALTRLDLTIDEAIHELQLDDVPPGLQELSLVGTLRSVHLPVQQLPRLRVLHISRMHLLTQLDCGQLPSLQRLVLDNCHKVSRLLGLQACTQLTHLALIECRKFTHGLDGATLRALNQLRHLEVTCAALTSLDVPSCSPSLTHLDVGGSALQSISLFLPNGVARTALRYCGVSRIIGTGNLWTGVSVCGWELRAVPNLEVLDICGQQQLPQGMLNLRPVPRLQRLMAAGVPLQTSLDLSPVSQLVQLDVSGTPIAVLQLEDCPLLQVLQCKRCRSLSSLDLTPVASTLTKLECSKSPLLQVLDCSACTQLTSLLCDECHQLSEIQLPAGGAPLAHLHAWSCHQLKTLGNLGACVSLRVLYAARTALATLDLSGARRLQELYVHECANLTRIDLSACTALRVLGVSGSGLGVVDVRCCGALEEVLRSGDVRVVGVRAGVRVVEDEWW